MRDEPTFRPGTALLWLTLLAAALLLAACLPSADETLGDKPSGTSDWPTLAAAPQTDGFARFDGETLHVTLNVTEAKTPTTDVEIGLYDDQGNFVSGTNWTTATRTGGTTWEGDITVSNVDGSSNPTTGLFYIYAILWSESGNLSYYRYDPSISTDKLSWKKYTGATSSSIGTLESEQATALNLTRFGIIAESYNFDGGTMPAQFTGTWTVASDNTWNSSAYGLKSAAIGDSASTCVTFTPNTSTVHGILFSSTVSSELDFDFLRYYVDGSQVDEWSGEVGWTQWHSQVSTGSHTFMWCYEKDVNTISGSDAAWLDLVGVY